MVPLRCIDLYPPHGIQRVHTFSYFLGACDHYGCKNGGTCTYQNYILLCQCTEEYSGKYCQLGKAKFKVRW